MTPEQRAREIIDNWSNGKGCLLERFTQALREKDGKLQELEIALAKAEEALKDLRNGKV